MRTGQLRDRVELVPTEGNLETGFAAFADVTLIRPEGLDIEQTYAEAQIAQWQIVIRNSATHQILLNSPTDWNVVFIRRGGLSVNLTAGSISDDRRFLVFRAEGGTLSQIILVQENDHPILTEDDMEILI